jgi:hypothetical protein
MSMKNSNDIIGNWTRDLPACSAGLQSIFIWKMLLVASWRYSAARVGGRMSGLCYYDKRTDTKHQYLPHKIMTMYNSILLSPTCLETCHCVVLRNVTLNSSHWWLEITRLHSVFSAHQFGRRVLVVCLTSSGQMVLTLWKCSLLHVSTTFSSHNRHSFPSTLAVTNMP